jgi:hypothetical protein
MKDFRIPGTPAIALGRNHVKSGAFQDRFGKGLERRRRLRIAERGNDLRWKRREVYDWVG